MDHNEHESLVNELAKGKKLAEERAGHLGGTSSSNIEDRLLKRILASYDEALNLLTRPKPQGQCQSVISSASDTSTPSVSVCNDTPPKDSSIGPLKRKSLEEEVRNMMTKMHQERLGKVCASNSLALSKALAESDPQEVCHLVEPLVPFYSSSVPNATPSNESRRSMQDVHTVIIDKSQETTLDYGYSWRKYGQKKVMGSEYPRSYYRCTYRHGMGCFATKQVQRSDDDPTIFNVTYRGMHTCHYADALLSKPKPEEKQE